MCTGAQRAYAKAVSADTFGDALFCCPQNCVIVICTFCYVCKCQLAIHSGLTFCAPQEGHKLFASALTVGLKFAVGIAFGNALFCRPQHCVMVICVLSDILERTLFIFGCRFACCTPQEGYSVCTGASCCGAKAAITVTCGNTCFHCPCQSICIPCICGNILKAAICCQSCHRHQAYQHAQNQQHNRKGSSLHTIYLR